MSDNASIVGRVQEYAAGEPDFYPIVMARLSPRAIAVFDNLIQTDIYFDSESYRVKYPEVWEGDGGLFPPALYGTGLGVLPGTARAPEAKEFDDALAFAQQELEPLVEEARWYKEPGVRGGTKMEMMQGLMIRGVPLVSAGIMSAGDYGFFKQNLDELADMYKSITEKDLPDFAAAIIASSSRKFVFFEGGLDQVIKRYHELVSEGKTEEQAARDAVF